MTSYQLFDALPAHVEDALRASVKRFGVLVPVVRDQHGTVIDGHHRARIADELGVRYRVDVVSVAGDDEAREIARTLNADRRQLTEEQRRAVVVELRREGHSERAIAGALGVSQPTVHRDLAREIDSGESISPERVSRQGGGSYPARRPSIVAAKSPQEADRAQAALALAPAPAGRVVDTRRMERVAREHVAVQRRAEPVKETTTDEHTEIRHGDFRDCLTDLNGTVDAIITDPPYPREFWHLYADLGALAHRVLKPNGVLAVMTGTRLEMLDHVEQEIGRHVRRRHRGVYLVPGQRWRDQVEHVAIGYKPILLFAHPDADNLPWLNDDVFVSDESRQDDRFHHWGQSESGFACLVERLTTQDALVLDPFLGGGTTAVACRSLGRRFIGCDTDAAAVSTARGRLT